MKHNILFKPATKDNIHKRMDKLFGADPSYHYWQELFDMIESEFPNLIIVKTTTHNSCDYFIRGDDPEILKNYYIDKKEPLAVFGIWIKVEENSIVILNNYCTLQEEVVARYNLLEPKKSIVDVLKCIVEKHNLINRSMDE